MLYLFAYFSNVFLAKIAKILEKNSIGRNFWTVGRRKLIFFQIQENFSQNPMVWSDWLKIATFRCCTKSSSDQIENLKQGKTPKNTLPNQISSHSMQ